MRAFSKMSCVIAALAAVALTATVANARPADRGRFAGAYNSASPQHPGSIPYDAGGVPFPTGHGTTSNSADFQLVR